MFIARIARVRCLVIGAVVIFNEHMIDKLSVGEIGKEMTVGDKVELANVMKEESEGRKDDQF